MAGLMLMTLLISNINSFGQAFISLSYPSPQVYTVGIPIVTVNPSVSGGPAAAGGNTTQAFVGNGMAAALDGTGTSAYFYNPLNTAVDAAGNIYVADAGNHKIRKVTPEGVVTTFAGTGSAGFLDGPGYTARFQHPSALAVDGAGNVFVADQQNHRIRKITPAGVVSTFAGSGAVGSFDYPIGTSATFQYPVGLAFDASGNLFVCDSWNNKIRRIDPLGAVTTFAGSGTQGSGNGALLSATFNKPTGIAVDASGNFYISDRYNHLIRKISGSSVTTLAGNGALGSADHATGTSASFNYPTNLCVDGSGFVYVSDQANNTIRKISSAGVVTTFAGLAGSASIVNGTGTSVVRFTSTYGLCMDKQGNIYVAQNSSNLIRKLVTKPYSIYPMVPGGLSFNNTNGQLTGIPTTGQSSRSYYVQAFNTTHSSTVATFSISVASLPAGITGSSNQNYIATYMPQNDSYSTAASAISASTNKDNVQTTIQYFDGLGRPSQTVMVKGTPGGTKDLVTPIEYDGLGRLNRNFMSYPASTTADGSFKSTGLADVLSYYAAPGSGVKTTAYPYTVPVYEKSPMNRIAEQGAPGKVWQPAIVGTDSTGHTQKIEYSVNSSSDTVKRWTISGTTVSTSANYDPGQLIKTISKDENWVSADGKAGTVEEYKNMEGQVVCKRVWQTSTVARATTYVYDEYQRLRYVIPPKVTAASLTEASTAAFDQLAYAYHYDTKGRLIEKKIPGKGWEEFVYDKMNRLAMSRDKVQSDLGKWLFTKYDGVGRAAYTGRIASVDSRATHQTAMDAATYVYVQRDNSNSTGINTGYTNAPPPTAVGAEIYTVNYYDDYSFWNNSFGAPSGGQSNNVKGLLTGGLVNVLGSSIMLLNANYYDGKGQLVQSKEQNNLPGTDFTSLTYNFQGQVLTSTRTHTQTSPAVTTMVYLTYEYDHLGRKTKTYEKIGNSGSTQVLLSELVYNEIGQLKDKKQADGFSTNTYLYNERGWLTKTDAPLFDMTLQYNHGTGGNFNGNITSMFTQANGNTAKTFTYTYDRLNRLTAGTTGTIFENAITYDPNGNINTLTRNGSAAQVYTYIGNRARKVTGGATRGYTYDANGNALTDTVNTFSYNVLNLPTVITGANASTYTYDATGRKLKRVKGAVTTQYINGIQYTGTTIDFVQTEEGVARRNTATQYLYDYNISDHLGNSRVTFELSGSTPTKIQADDYYPFGKRIISTPGVGVDMKYTYNGKEIQDGLEQYDYGARFYDPVVARWTSVDPMAELDRAYSPFNYARNNPMRYIDPTGMIWEDPEEAKKLKERILATLGQIQSDKVKLQGQIDNSEGLTDKAKGKLQKKIDMLSERATELARSSNDIDELGASENIFRLASGSDYNHVVKDKDGVINIMGPNDALHIHEIRHVADALKSVQGLEFNGDYIGKKGLGAFFTSERSGHRAQFAYDPKSISSVSSFNQINIRFLGTLMDSEGKPVYKIFNDYWKQLSNEEKKSIE